MSGLPEGWALAYFDEIAAQEKGAIRRGPFGGSLKKEIFVSNGYKVYEQQNAIRNDFDIGSYYIDENKYKEMIGFNVYPNDIIISCAGTIGKVAIVPTGAKQGIINQALMRIRPNLLVISPYYLKLYLKSPLAKKEIFEQSVGTALKNLAAISEIKKTRIPLPPLKEQHRIVAKLDRLFARSRRAREELERIRKLCDRYKQAVLAAAFRGDLTAGWRQKKVDEYASSGLWSIPHQWQWHQMSEVCEHITKGTTPSKDKMSSVDTGIPFIKVYNLTFDGALDFSIDPTFVDLETHEKFLKRSRVYPGDVLMNIVGPPLGKVSIVPGTYPEWNINQAIAIFRARPKILDRFISNYLLFEKTVNWCIQEAKATAGQFNLTLRICQDIPIPVPPIEEQKEIVRQIEKTVQSN